MRFPTKTISTKTQLINGKRVLSFNSTRYHPCDIKKLPYKDQKTFFKLDREYDANLVAQHNWKTKVADDKGRRGLLANLCRDRKNLFKKYIAEESRRNDEIGRAFVTNKMPKIDQAIASVAEHSRSGSIDLIREVELHQTSFAPDRTEDSRSVLAKSVKPFNHYV